MDISNMYLQYASVQNGDSKSAEYRHELTLTDYVRLVKNLKEDYVRLEGLNRVKDDALENLTSQLDHMKESMRQGSQTIESCNEAIEKQKATMAEMDQLTKDLTKKAQTAREAINSVKREHQERLKNEMEANKREAREKDAKIKQLQSANKALEREKETLIQRHDNMKRKYGEKLTEEKKKAKDEAQEELDKQNAVLQKTRAYYEAQIKEKNKKIEKLGDELHQCKMAKKNTPESIEAAYLRTISINSSAKSKKSPRSSLKRSKSKNEDDPNIEFLEQEIKSRSRVGTSRSNKRRVTFEDQDGDGLDEPQPSTSSKRTSNSKESDDDSSKYLELRSKPKADDEDHLNSSLEEELLGVPIDGEQQSSQGKRVKLTKRVPEDMDTD